MSQTLSDDSPSERKPTFDDLGPLGSHDRPLPRKRGMRPPPVRPSKPSLPSAPPWDGDDRLL